MTSLTWRLAAMVAVTIVAGACAEATPTPAPSPPAEPPPAFPADPPQPAAVADLDEKWLDDESRDLVPLIQAGELVEATIQSGNEGAIVAEAVRRGGRGEVLGPNSVSVTADLATVLALVARDDVAFAAIREDLRAMRVVSERQPTLGQVPHPGSPYDANPVPVDAVRGDVPPDRLVPLLRGLGRAIVTFDGRPYASLSVHGTCGSETCVLSATGRIAGSGDVFDGWSLQAGVGSGWRPVAGTEDRELSAIPRRFVRAAEWFARADERAAARIAQYTTIGQVRWDPATPGLIAIRYQRGCLGGVGFPGTRVAATGVCLRFLVVVVDLTTGQVVSVTESIDSQ
jgi:hypothetical protein